jgi:predicted signal transduction protein with EAL and GGDEF domain
VDPLSPGPEPAGPSAAQAQAELARLGVEVETMQAVLVRLLQDVVDAEARLVDTHAAQLVEANERLVLAALTSHDQAQAAVRALAEAEHSAALDALTRLPNRTTLLDRFAQALAQARRHGTRTISSGSTTPTGMPLVMRCSGRSPSAWSRPCARPTPSAATAATSSSSCWRS